MFPFFLFYSPSACPSWKASCKLKSGLSHSGLRTTGPAGLKTGPRRFPAAQSSQNHHKISLNPHRNPSKTSCNLLRHLWKRHRASWSLARMFLDRTPDSFMSHNASAVAGSPLCGALDPPRQALCLRMAYRVPYPNQPAHIPFLLIILPNLPFPLDISFGYILRIYIHTE